MRSLDAFPLKRLRSWRSHLDQNLTFLVLVFTLGIGYAQGLPAFSGSFIALQAYMAIPEVVNEAASDKQQSHRYR
eukprot:812193-Amphidinium_carterae.1